MMFLKDASFIAKKTFDEYDKNQDGVLSVAEIKPLLERISELLNLPKVNDADIEAGIKKLDLNKNKVLEFNEFFNFFRGVYRELENE